MQEMVFRSPRGKEIVFDDWVDNRAEYGSYWTNMCPHCHHQHRAILGKRASDDGAIGICSVKGCENEAKYYVDFDEKEVAFI